MRPRTTLEDVVTGLVLGRPAAALWGLAADACEAALLWTVAIPVWMLGVPPHHGRFWLWRPSVGPLRARLYAGYFPSLDEPRYTWADRWRWGVEAGAEGGRWEAIVTLDVLPYRSSEERLRQGLETRCARCGEPLSAVIDGVWQADGQGGAMHEGCAL